MLVHADGKARERTSAEEFRVALQVVLLGFLFNSGEFRGIFQHALRIKNVLVKIHRLRNNPLFILLGNLSLRVVELDAVAVGGNVATRHHDGRERLVDTVQCNRRRRDATAVHDLPGAVLARLHERLQDAFRTRAQVTRNRNRLLALVALFAVLDKRARIHVAHAVRHRGHQPAGTARTECHAGLLHHILHRNAHRNLYSLKNFLLRKDKKISPRTIR